MCLQGRERDLFRIAVLITDDDQRQGIDMGGHNRSRARDVGVGAVSAHHRAGRSARPAVVITAAALSAALSPVPFATASTLTTPKALATVDLARIVHETRV